MDKKIPNKIKPGYKHTKLGWVPEEWKAVEFGEFAKRYNEKYNPLNNKKDSICIELENIESETGKVLDFYQASSQKSIKSTFKKDHVLFGKLRPYLKKFWYASIDGVCSSEIWVLKANDNIIESRFLYYIIQSHKFIELCKVSSGTKMPRADWDYISKILFNIPPISEQNKIARILTTWDKAIEKTEQLIKAKTQLKKGLMQQLLTGKRRFPAFAKTSADEREFEGEEWNEYIFGDLGMTYTGLTGKNKNDFGQGLPYIPFMNVMNNSRINPDQMDYVNINYGEKQNNVEYGDFFFTTSSETPEEAGMSSVLLNNLENTYLNSFCFGYRLNDFETLLPEFSRFYLRSFLVRKKYSG